jgi:methionine-rich copper-binding protein CopC
VAVAAAVLAGAAAGALGYAVPASAHSQLESAAPASGAVVRGQPGAVTLTFNEQVRLKYSTVAIERSDGGSYRRGTLSQRDTTLRQDVYPLPSGEYTVAWRVVSADGHPVRGEFRFTVRLPAGAEPPTRSPSQATSPVAERTSATSSIVFWVAAVAGIAAVLVALVFAGRRSRSRSL